MKVLVVDDDPSMRRLVARLASRHPAAVVRQAEDGVAALAAIEAERPDLIFTDMMMPNLGGVGLLEAIRGSTEYREIPVVAVSSIAEKAMVLRMVDLGIDDYLLKPLDPAIAGERFDAILAKIAARPLHGGTADQGSGKLLLIDNQTGYGDTVRAALSGRLEVVDGMTAAAALAWGIANVPAVALVAEGLPMPGTEAVAKGLRESGKTRLVLLVDAPSDAADGFDAVVTRTFAPKKLMDTLEPVLPSDVVGHNQIGTLLKAEVAEVLSAACRQSVGLLAGQDSAVATDPMTIPADAVTFRIVLTGAQHETGVGLYLVASPGDVTALNTTASPPHDNGASLLSAIATHAGARVGQALTQRGWNVTVSEPEATADGMDLATCEARIDLRTESGQGIVALLRLIVKQEGDEPAPMDEAVSPPSVETPPAEGEVPA